MLGKIIRGDLPTHSHLQAVLVHRNPVKHPTDSPPARNHQSSYAVHLVASASLGVDTLRNNLLWTPVRHFNARFAPRHSERDTIGSVTKRHYISHSSSGYVPYKGRVLPEYPRPSLAACTVARRPRAMPTLNPIITRPVKHGASKSALFIEKTILFSIFA